MSDRRENEPVSSDNPAGEREVQRLLQTAGLRESLPAQDLALLRRQARESWRAEVPDRRRTRRFLGAGILAMAAVLIAAAGIAWWWTLHQTPPSAEPVARVVWAAGAGAPSDVPLGGHTLPAGAVLVTAPAGEPRSRLALRLEGGVELRLDHSTAVMLTSATVVELERGAVYVDTGDDEDRTSGIEVRTPLGIARDVGTRFVVRYVMEENPVLFVRVREGEVVVETGDRHEATGAGTELEMRADGMLERRPAPSFGESWEWVLSAAPPFAGRSVGDLLRWSSRETGWEVRFGDPELAARADRATVHGAIEGLAPDEAAFVVLPAAGLRGDLRDGSLFVDEAE